MFNEISRNQKAFLRYIESAYHFSDEKILKRREAILNTEGTISQTPYLESSAKYKLGNLFADLNLAPEITLGLTKLAQKHVLFNPPYQHQADALESVLTKRKNIIVTTGTGSGKTECFLLPILGRLLTEAKKASFKERAVRALLLYPMNALVNDQLGRLRLLFASAPCLDLFNSLGGRPVKFGRYTGRTLFPGRIPLPTTVEEQKKYAEKMSRKLEGLKFFADLADKAINSSDEEAKKRAMTAVRLLVEKGKFPAVYSDPQEAAGGFLTWFGTSGTRWLNDGQLARTVERKGDAELLVRHEMQAAPPDILITNYSMLEYMLLRPIERNIFTETKNYFRDHPQERFLLVLDEAHLYNGAQGTEVAMLIRRLKHRLQLNEDQFQVICTSASFGESDSAARFAAELTGVPEESVIAIASDNNKLPQLPSGPGTTKNAEWLLAQDASELRARRDKNAEISSQIEALPVFGRLANLTSLTRVPDDPMTEENMEGPQPIDTLAEKLFPGVEKTTADKAADRLVEIASAVKKRDGIPLFAARVHRFYRGLPGLWMCGNPNCGEISAIPVRHCPHCNSRVFELYSCSKCGSPFLMAYTNDICNPCYLWSEACGRVDGAEGNSGKIYLLLQEPLDAFKCKGAPRFLNYYTGTLSENPSKDRTRPVWIPLVDTAKKGTREEDRLFLSCPICREKVDYIRNHRTKGDRPFQELVASQLLEQPINPSVKTPLQGRKVLIFSDGRQAASRLAGTLTSDSLRDAVRPLLIDGYQYLMDRFHDDETQLLHYAYLAVLTGAFHHGITLSPILKENEHFAEHTRKINKKLGLNNVKWQTVRLDAESFRPPELLLTAIYETLFNETSGCQAIALAHFVSIPNDDDEWNALPVPNNVVPENAGEWKRNLLDLWIQLMIEKRAIFLAETPDSMIDNDQKPYPRRADGKFIEALSEILGCKSFVKKSFSYDKNNTPIWLEYLKENYGTEKTANGFFLNSAKLQFVEKGLDGWLRCGICSRIYPDNPLTKERCPFCRTEGHVFKVDEQKNVALKRISVYREATDHMRKTQTVPHPFIAKEHTAAIGAQTGSEDAFTRAEKYEIRFQDIELPDIGDRETNIPVDILSCTTTMEVGIDIGALSAVAMRNVPPNRSNYQQRSGRAGRRGTSLSTILTYADQDSHNQRYFSNSAAMIGGPIKNPILYINNERIVERHLFALIISLFQQERIQDQMDPNVFSSLGTVRDFRCGGVEDFSFAGLQQWMADRRKMITDALKTVLHGNDAFDNAWIEEIPNGLIKMLEDKIVKIPATSGENGSGDAEDGTEDETVENPDAPRNQEKLLDLLFDKSILPSYAFPTDVVGMYVFDQEQSKQKKRPVLRYAPTYGLTQALSSYAPGKEVYIDGKRHFSFALWSPVPGELKRAWDKRQLYYECQCGHVKIDDKFKEDKVGEIIRCNGCGNDTLGPARIWFIPPGFAQPCDISEELSQHDIPAISFTTHAKLTADFNDVQPDYQNGHWTYWKKKASLYLTNRGVWQNRFSGFHFCAECGRIEPADWHNDTHSEYSMFAVDQNSGRRKPHKKPYPLRKSYSGQTSERAECRNFSLQQNVVLGTKFNSDVVLIRLDLDGLKGLRPGSHLARVALGTLAVAMCLTVISELEIDPNSVGGEFRPSSTSRGNLGLEADVFLYDNVSDGAGFVEAATKDFPHFLKRVLNRLEGCDCEYGCPRCLQTYQNRFIHDDMDRNMAAGLLRFLLDGKEPHLLDSTEDRLLKTLAEDLRDKGYVPVLHKGHIEVGGKRCLITHSLTGKPATLRSLQVAQMFPNSIRIDHLLVDRALLAATQKVLKELP